MANYEKCNRCEKRNTPLLSGGNWYDWVCQPCLEIINKPPCATKNRHPQRLANLLNRN